jgi:hypothetical protein
MAVILGACTNFIIKAAYDPQRSLDIFNYLDSIADINS